MVPCRAPYLKTRILLLRQLLHFFTMTKGGDYEMIKTANEKRPKPDAMLPPRRGAIKVRIVKLLAEKLKLVSLSLSVRMYPPPVADVGEAGWAASTFPKPDVMLPPRRGAVKVMIVKLLAEKLKLVSLSQCVCPSPVADLGEAGGAASTSTSTSAISAISRANKYI
ncbi:hypothetical protein CDL15_Pgr004559 [Punica granatum]|uniref:Uncharacterized protein n=2 Tax=Punica granatum TaxID=22663 RepID=A0A218WS43_PUNGR|nr:hypothetical protein CDL15_Pgr004559 [Punica granatum]